MILRVRLTKGEEVRHVAHLGFMRAVERAIRRAGLPMAFTEGYSPHPKYSFAAALGVGTTSESEYVDIELARDIPVAEAFDALRRTLPPGIDALAACSVRGKSKLASGVEYASYRAVVPEALIAAAHDFMESESHIGSAKTKGGEREIDMRPLVRDMHIVGGNMIEFTCAAGGRAHLRPQDLLSELARTAQLDFEPGASRLVRTGLYFDCKGEMVLPMSCGCEDTVTGGVEDPRS